MILKKLNARTAYRLGREDATRGSPASSMSLHYHSYREGYLDGCVRPQSEPRRRHIWANAVLVAEIARWKQFAARHGLGEEDLRF